jgi:hypothetical protein
MPSLSNPRSSLEMKPDKTPRIVSGQGKGKDSSSYWKVDYPAE